MFLLRITQKWRGERISESGSENSAPLRGGEGTIGGNRRSACRETGVTPMDDWMRSRSVRLLLGMALGLAACGFSMGYSGFYAPSTDGVADAAKTPPPAPPAALAASSISVSVSIPADVAFTNIPTV